MKTISAPIIPLVIAAIALLPASPASAAPSEFNRQSSTAHLEWHTGARTAYTTEKIAIESITNATTGEIQTKKHRYVVVRSGLNYLDEAGQWQESQDLVELLPDGRAAALRAQNKIYFSPNLNGPAPITVVTPDNMTLNTRILGLFYYDASSGRGVLLSTVKNSSGELLPPNQVLYKGALNCGDIRVTCTREGFETDFILTRKPKPPEAYSLNPATTRLELWHEYGDTPVPKRFSRILSRESNPELRRTMAEPDLIDETLNFGTLWFPPGRAFATSGLQERGPETPAEIQLPNSANRQDRLPVAKRWLQIQGKQVLVESVPWSTVETEIKSLPEAAAADRPTDADRAYAGRRLPENQSSPAPKGERIKVATAKYNPRGFVMDYIVVSGSGDYTFEQSTTYLIDGTFYTGGTITYEPACVVKYANGTQAILYGDIVCNWATLTSKDDDTVGETIDGSTHMPTIGPYQPLSVYYIDHNLSLTGFTIRWAHVGMQLDANGCGDISHYVQGCAFEFCETALYANNCYVTLDTVTACGVTTPIYTPSPECTTFSGTIDPGTGCSVDNDGNGIPDIWEFQYFGTAHIDPSADPDSDGVNNLDEYRQGRNPAVVGTTSDSNNQIKLQAYTPLK